MMEGEVDDEDDDDVYGGSSGLTSLTSFLC